MALVLPGVAACSSTSQGHPTSESCIAVSTVPTMKIALTSIYVNVWNAGGKAGQAASVATQLKWRGVHIIATGNDPSAGAPPEHAEIRYGPNGKQIALTLAEQIKDAKLTQDDRSNPSVDVVIGSKFALVPVPPPSPSKVTVNVFNAYVLPGTAASLSRDLHKRGFKIGQVGNDPKRGYYPDNAVVIRYGLQGEPAARRAALQFKGARMLPDGRKGPDVDVVIGSKWQDNVVLPVAQATAPPTPSPKPSKCTTPTTSS